MATKVITGRDIEYMSFELLGEEQLPSNGYAKLTRKETVMSGIKA